MVPEYVSWSKTSTSNFLAFLFLHVAGHNSGINHDPGHSFMTDGSDVKERIGNGLSTFEDHFVGNPDVLRLMLERKFTDVEFEDNLEKNRKSNEEIRNQRPGDSNINKLSIKVTGNSPNHNWNH